MSTTSFQVFGSAVYYNEEECGIYKLDGLSHNYAVMNPKLLFQNIDQLDIPQARKSVTALLDLARLQATWCETPYNLGHPILVGPAPSAVGTNEREGILNLQELCERILAALPKRR